MYAYIRTTVYSKASNEYNQWNILILNAINVLYYYYVRRETEVRDKSRASACHI